MKYPLSWINDTISWSPLNWERVSTRIPRTAALAALVAAARVLRVARLVGIATCAEVGTGCGSGVVGGMEGTLGETEVFGGWWRMLLQVAASARVRAYNC